MVSKKTLLTDARYLGFVGRYRLDWVRFAHDVVGEKLTWQQRDVVGEVQVEGSRVSVASGHGTGKSASSAIMILAFVIAYPRARVVLTANKVGQVKIGVFKYLQHYWAKIIGRFPWLEGYFVLTMEQFYAVGFQGVWGVTIKGYRLGNEESLAGEHADHLLYIVDEASGLSDKAFDVITGALTQADNRLLLLSQPTRSTGFFYDTHHSLKRHGPGERGFVAIQLNSEKSLLVTPEYIEDWERKAGGREAPEYCIRVRGAFSDHTAGFLLGRAETERCFAVDVEHDEDFGYVALADVAGGEGRDSSVLNICKVSGWGDERSVESVDVHEMPDGVNGHDFAHEIMRLVASYPNITIGVDADGYGKITAQALERSGMTVARIHWGAPPHSREHKRRFAKKKDYCCVMVHDAVKDGRLKLFSANPVLRQKTLEQFTRIPYSFNERGQWLIETKKRMAAQGIKSPDICDTYAFAWLVDYIAAGVDVGGGEADEHLDWAGELLAAND